MRTRADDERDLALLEDMREGADWRALAVRYGLSLARVRALAAAAGYQKEK